jgi:inner membrane protein
MRFPLLAKAAAIGLIIVLLMGVLARIGGLVAERRMRQVTAMHSVAQSLSSAQTLVGPLLQRKCAETWHRIESEGGQRHTVPEKREFTLVSAPDLLAAESQASAEARYRGLFKVNGYAGTTSLKARWGGLATLQPRREHKDSRLQCEPVVVLLALSDPRGIRTARVAIDGAPAAVRPGTGHGSYPLGLNAALDDARSNRADEALEVSVQLDLVGTARLSLVPAARELTWSLHSDWPHPSFGGRFLPAARTVDASGFSARWSVSALASPAAVDVEQGQALCVVDDRPADDEGDLTSYARPPMNGTPSKRCVDTIDVSFIDPVNPYSLTDRATKYALLFIVLTFAAVALTEALAGRRVHPVQYSLVGLALALFYLLLLGLSEHLSFRSAYAVASLGCVGLLGYYGRYMLGTWRAAAAFGAGIALLYGLLWLLLRMEQWSLAIGAVMLFAALSAVMVLTRRVDWYALAEGLRQRTPAPKQ